MNVDPTGTCISVIWRRVSLAGHVVRAEGGMAAGGIVRLSASARALPSAPSIETAIRRDGSYVYLNLPAGSYEAAGYEATGIPEQRRNIKPQAVKVPAVDRTKPLPAKWLAFDLTLETTTKEQVTSGPP